MTQQSGSTPFAFFSSFIADHTKDFTGREWVFAEIDRWLADPAGPSFFIITGEPGVGKSAIAAWLMQVSDIAAYHFCIARNDPTIDPTLFARSISQQLCRFDGFAAGILKDSNINLRLVQDIQANYGQAIALKIENLVVNAPTPSTAFIHAVLEPLRVLCAGGFDCQIVILVDALDEAARYERNETIVKLLANAGVLPRQVRIVLTSDPEGAALDSFKQQRIQYFPLDAGQPENMNDIRRYVRDQLRANAALRARLAENALNDETFIERVATASEGNFLYLVRQLSAIAAGTQSFDRLEALSQGLDGMYFDFLQRRTAVDKEQPWHFYRPLLGVLAAAREPLSEQQLAGFTGLRDQNVHDILAASRQFLEPKAAEQGRYQFYHQSWIDFLVDRGKAGDFWIDLVPIHRQVGNYYLEQFKSDWSRCDLYGLRYLGTHMRQGKDCKQVGELLEGAFLEQKARQLEKVSALVEAHEFAVFLAHCGEEHWPSLIKAAQDYCGRLKGIHRADQSAAQSKVETLLERQEIQQLEDLVEVEKDEPRQGLLRLAVSVLLDGAGYSDVASSQWKRGSDIARAAKYDHPQRELVEALLTKTDVSSPPLGARQKCSLSEEAVGRGYPSDSALRGTVAHRTVPTGVFLASYVGGYLAQEYGIHLIWALVFYCLSGYLLWLWRPGPQLGNGGIVGIIGVLAIVTVWELLRRVASLTKKAARNWLMRSPLAIYQVFSGMLVAFGDASRSERTAILERAMRLHQALLRARSAPAEPKPSSPWLDIVSQMVKRTISECETPKEAVHWLQVCSDTDVGYELVAVVGEGLDSLKPHWCAPIFSESFRRLPSGQRRYILRVVAQVWDRLADPQALLDGLEGMDMEEESSLEVIGQLSGAPRSFLAKTLLLTLEPSSAVHRRTRVWELGREFGQYLSHAWWQLVRTFRFPLCHLEIVLQSVIWLPLFPGILFIGVLFFYLAIFAVPMLSVNYLAGMTNDPFRLGALRHVDDPLELCHRIEKALSMGGDISSWPSGRVRNTVFAVRLLLQSGPGADLSMQYRARSVPSVLTRLRKERLLPKDPELVLAYMSDPQIIWELANLPEDTSHDKPIAPPTLNAHREQLKRVLPIVSTLRGVVAGSILSCFLYGLPLVTAARLAPVELAGLLTTPGLLVLGCLCVAFTTYQYMPRNPATHSLISRLGIDCDKLPIWLLLIAGTVSLVFVGAVNMGVAVLALMILLLWTNLLIPEFIARWRGANLLYPTRKRLWLQRALMTCTLCMAALVLIVMLVGLSRFAVLMHV